MKLHLVDGTFELFRHYYGAPKAQTSDGTEVGAVRGILRTLHGLLSEDDATHVGVAFDRVIESFRNDMFPGYKTGAGIEPELLSQFPMAEQAARAIGVVVWPMVRYEADDALATAAHRWRSEVHQVQICSPDKDLAQCVTGDQVVLRDRIRGKVLDEQGVFDKFGVPPAAIPDYLALVGDTADGIPGVPRWGAKSASTVLARYGTLEAIPLDHEEWDIKVRGARGLVENLRAANGHVQLYKQLATLRTDVPIPESIGEMEWVGADRERLEDLCERIEYDRFLERVERWR